LTDSLTLSLLILFAIVIVLLLAAELWRFRGLGRERGRSSPRMEVKKSRATAVPRGPSARQEPGFESLDLPTVARIEPGFSLHDGGVSPIGPAETGSMQATVAPDAATLEPGDHATPGMLGISMRESSSIEPQREQLPDPPIAVALTAKAPEVSRPVASLAAKSVRSSDLPSRAASAEPPPDFVLAPQSSLVPEIVSEAERTTLTVPTDDPALASSPTLSTTTDCIVDLACTTNIPGERLVSIAQGFRRCGTKPVMIEVPISGVTPSAARHWRAPLLGDSCRAIRIGILLDNRLGPLNAIEFSEFLARVEETAESLGAHFTPPQMSEVLLAARRLDMDCAQLDSNVGLNVDASGVLSQGQFAALAGPLMIVERGSNRYVRLDEHGDLIFSISLGDRPNRLTFLLDLPKVHHPQDAWQQMVECALLAARLLPGRLVDDGGKPLTERFLENNATQVHQRALALEAVGLKAGTVAARRVFN